MKKHKKVPRALVFHPHLLGLVLVPVLLAKTLAQTPSATKPVPVVPLAQAEKTAPMAFLERLRKAPARAVDVAGNMVAPDKINIEFEWDGSLCRPSITNHDTKPLQLKNIILFDLAEHGLDPATPVYGEGFQMLAQNTGSLGKLDYRGPYPDAVHYKIPEPDGIPTVYGMMTLDLGKKGYVLLGFTSCKRFVGRFSFDGKLLRVSVDPEGLELAPGETWKLEEFIALAGPDRNELLDRLAAGICKNHPPLPQPAFKDRVGWCTWYGVGASGNQKIITDTVARFAEILPELRFIQIDEGYCDLGEWLEPLPQFGDMQTTLHAIRAKGFLPGMWLAPFIAQPDSKVLKEHPDWFVKNAEGLPLDSSKIGFGGWAPGPWRVLDGTNPDTQKHLEDVFHTMRETWGVTYFKLDANYWGAIHGGRHSDPKATRVEAYRRGMEAILRGAGPDAVILGCNAPIWPSLGLVNAMRTSNDVSRSWSSFADTARENLNRSWQNGRLWVCDPDCVLLAGEAKVSPDTWRFHATAIHAIGGLVLSGDKVENLGPSQLATLRKLIPPTGKSARFENSRLETGITDMGARQYHYLFNWDTAPADRVIHLKQRSRLKDFWTGDDLGVHEGDFLVKAVSGQSARLIEAVPNP